MNKKSELFYRQPLRRRNFLKLAAATAATTLLLPECLKAASMPLVKKSIPRTNEKLPIIGLGSARTFDVTGEDSIKNLLPIMQAFFDNGGAVIDSSPMYGNAEAVIGKMLQRIDNKKSMFAATKVWIDGKDEGVKQMQQSMKLFGIEKFDLMQIHNLRDWKVHLDTLKEWKKQGLIRYIGITTSHGRFHDELEEILKKHKEFDFLQLSYNLGNRKAEKKLLPIAADKGVAVIANRPFQNGTLFRKSKGQKLPEWTQEFNCKSWGQFFLKFAVSHPNVTCSIPATSNLEHMVDNMGAGYGVLPDKKQREKMISYFDKL